MSTWEKFKNAKISSKDKMIGGVCGGLGEATGIPSWMWRAIFLVCLLFFGFGILPYLILWICLPKEKEE